uniref:Threonylcarbamoyl-AMP synthase n=1 Tax=Ornithodoros turicata TaxID=34597 RepID=A0A2R5LD53_9ACAR
MRTWKELGVRLYSTFFQIKSTSRVMPRIIPIKLGTVQNGFCVAQSAADALKAGGVIAVPTDTIYGIATLAQRSTSVEKLYAIKKRNYEKPIAICVHEISEIHRWANAHVPELLLQRLFPGAVTALFQRSKDLNPDLNNSTSLVGIRIPNCHFIRQVARYCGEPLALTSANVSSLSSTLSIHEFQELWPLLDVVFDGGELGSGDAERTGSTVVDLSVPGCYRIIRPGCACMETKKILEEFHLEEL